MDRQRFLAVLSEDGAVGGSSRCRPSGRHTSTSGGRQSWEGELISTWDCPCGGRKGSNWFASMALSNSSSTGGC